VQASCLHSGWDEAQPGRLRYKAAKMAALQGSLTDGLGAEHAIQGVARRDDGDAACRPSGE